MAANLIVDPGKAEGDPASRQASGRDRRRADDRACLAARGGGRLRAGRGRRRRARHLRGGRGRRRRSPDDAGGSYERLRPHLRGGGEARSAGQARHHRQPARGLCRRSSRASCAPASAPLGDPAADIGTIAAEIVREEERTDPNVVKVVGSPLKFGSALCARSTSRAPRALGRGPALPSYRSLRLSARGALHASCRFRRRRSNCARSWSSFGRSRQA